MISHVVIFKFENSQSPDLEIACTRLRSLAGRVPQLRSLEVGTNLVQSSRAFDLALVAKFDSLKDLEDYQIHPYHAEVAKYMRSVTSKIISVDFETMN